ncbi:MAG: M3 family metallopeptidase [Holophagales bacterium]|nr:M3 family metallopeptidase [Holophagales bacterium]
MRRVLTAVAGLAMAMPCLAQPAAEPKPETNPFFMEWATPFGMAPFEKIQAAHFVPAFEAGIAARKKEIEAIASNPEAPTFANTVEALENGGLALSKVSDVFFTLSGAETNDEIQAITRKVSPLLSSLRDDVRLNEKLFARVKAVWEKRDTLGLTPEQKKLVEDGYKDFVRGGANLSPEQKTRFREVNQELSALGIRFSDNLLKETNSWRLVVEKKEDLAGLPPGVVAAAADAAKAAKLEGKWVFTLQSPSIWPFLTFAENRALRKEILTAYTTRCDKGGETDNKELLSKMAALRAERAKLLGFATWADFVLDDNMAKTPARVYELLDRVWKPALEVAKVDAKDLAAALKADGKVGPLEPWDWRYYAEKVRKARYDLDDQALRPYFALDRVREGAFSVANRLYGITFTERTDVPKYHSEVKTFEVKDADGSFLALFTTDFHPRPGKRGGAWCGRLREQWVKDGKDVRPIVTNVMNFTRPSGDAPALLSLEEVETLFHEFGHALHRILSRVTYRSMSGVPRDFVELPSQIMENWALEPEVLKGYAKHWKTSEPIPAALVAKIHESELYGQGFATVEYAAAAYLDMNWHTLTEPKVENATAFETASLAKIGLIPEIVSRYRSPYFQHIFGPGGGYSAGYYSYLWSEILDADAFEAFREKGIFDKTTATAFRKNILEKGGTAEAMSLYKGFRGREPSVQPLLVRRGLTPAATAKTATTAPATH